MEHDSRSRLAAALCQRRIWVRTAYACESGGVVFVLLRMHALLPTAHHSSGGLMTAADAQQLPATGCVVLVC